MQGATGSAAGYVTLRHRGSTPCSLLGKPALLIGGADHSPDWRLSTMRLPLEGEDRPWGKLRGLRPGEEAGFGLHTINWCGEDSPRVELARPGGTVPLVREDDSMNVTGARCDAPKHPATIAVTRFLPPPDKSKALPLRAEIDGAPLGKNPAFELRRGERFRYRLALTNVSRRPFRFVQCPVYEQGLADPPAKERFVLNCRPAGTIDPRERAVFEMVFDVPGNAPIGPNAFSWSLVGGGDDPPWAPAPVEIRD
jgi:hypothetical protein